MVNENESLPSEPGTDILGRSSGREENDREDEYPGHMPFEKR
jgi:hypothetical protein